MSNNANATRQSLSQAATALIFSAAGPQRVA
jgi:hypothetical protein